MSKRKRKQRTAIDARVPRELAAIDAALAQMLAGTAPRTPGTLGDAVRRVQGAGHAARIWSVEGPAACGECPARDGVLVLSCTEETRRLQRDVAGIDARVRPLLVVAFDGHRDEMLSALLDVEDAKRLVNSLTEAIAAVEAQEAPA